MQRIRGYWIMAGAIALSVGAVAVEAFPVSSDALSPPAAAADALISLSFIWAGALAAHLRPRHSTGPLMVAVGVLWAAANLGFAQDSDLLRTTGVMMLGVFGAPLAHLLLQFPGNRLRDRGDRLLVGLIYVHLTVQWWLVLLFFDDGGRNLLAVWPDEGVYDVLWIVQGAISALCAIAMFVRLLRRWKSASPPLRRALGPVLATGLFAAIVVSITAPVAFSLPEAEGSVDAVSFVWSVAFAAIPVGFLIGLLRTRATRFHLGRLLGELHSAVPPHGVRHALARAVGDPSLQVAYWIPELGGYRDGAGAPVALDRPGGRTITVLEPGDPPTTVLLHDPALTHDPGLLEGVGQAARLALENTRLHAELQAQLNEVIAARQRIVEAADRERRRIERDLHDGAQQTLVSLSLVAQMLEAKLAGGNGTQSLAATTAGLAQQAIDELRGLAHGVYPVRLTTDGLGGALEGLRESAPVKIKLDVELRHRLPAAVEAAGYFVCCEAVTNAAKHAGTDRVEVSVREENGLALEVRDRGRGGADVSAGSGLVGLADRVAALGGTLEVDSPEGEGTVLRARIPCAPLVGADV